MVESCAREGGAAVCAGEAKVQAVTWAELARVRERGPTSWRIAGMLARRILADGTVECVIEVFAAVRAGLQVALVDPLMPTR